MKQHAVFLNPQCVSRSILHTLPSCCFPELATGAGWSRFWLMQKCQGRQTRWFLSVVPLKNGWCCLLGRFTEKFDPFSGHRFQSNMVDFTK